MQRWIRGLTTFGTVAGVIVVVFGFVAYVTAGVTTGLIISIAILIVGPAEDVLKALARRRAGTPESGEAWATIVDQTTSIAFVLLLGVVIYIGLRAAGP